MNKKELIKFEKEIVTLWEAGKIKTPVHLSGGNETELIKIFKKIKKDDYVFSTHRSHYHYLLKGGSPKKLKKMILNGESMHIFDKRLKFHTSSIVAGTPAIAVGVAMGLKRKKSKNKVWCFIGDGVVDEGNFFEAYRYACTKDLPIVFVIEDNDRSVETDVKERWGSNSSQIAIDNKHWIKYGYTPTYPHVGTNKWITFT